MTADFSPQRKAIIAAQTQKLKSEMALNKLRKALSLTQDELASKLNVKQPAISRLEQRSDMYISHLREVIGAMGGKLEITVRFDNDEVKITNFDLVQSQIKHYSSQAVEFSEQAAVASRERDFSKGKALMKQAYEASQNCQNLIEQYQKSLEPQSKS